jgi:hypothetical protein
VVKNFGDFISESVKPAPIDAFTPLGYKPHARQKLFHEASAKRYDAILFGGARGGGKAVSSGILVPTPDGFVKHGDVHPGDYVIGINGEPNLVVSETETWNIPGYKFTFDDGSEVITNGEHLWFTYTAKELEAMTRRDPEWRARRRATGSRGELVTSLMTKKNSEKGEAHVSPPVTGSVKTTAEIVATLRVEDGHGKQILRNNHAIPVAASLVLPEKNLPLDPYVLGAWLGDGFSAEGNGEDQEVFDNIKKFFKIHWSRATIADNDNFFVINFEGLKSVLNSIGLLNNKHVPEEYLWASEEQRLSLLQGLMDTDGCANKDGSVEFCNTNFNLAESVAILARSLGHKATIREGRATLYGKDCGPKWTVKFTSKMPLFRIQRKLDRLHLDAPVRRTRNFRYIVSAERTDPTEMKCISVESPDGLYLVTEHFIPTHNSACLLMDAIHNAVNFPGMKIACFRRTYPELEESFLTELGTRRGYARELGAKWNGTNKILSFPNGSIINFLYAENMVDASRVQGGQYQIIYIDEASLMQQEVIQHLEELLRTADKLLPVIGLRLASNPGSVSHGYLKSRFIKPTDRGKKIYYESIGSGGAKRSAVFIKSTVDDNPFINEGYKNTLDAIPDPQRRAAMRDGDWDAMVGAYFDTFSRKRHVITDKFTLPKEWQRYAGIDYGYAREWAAIWCAIDNDGRMWAYREIYARGVLPADQAKLILETEKAHEEYDVIRVADKSMWGNHGTPLSPADTYGLEGCGINQSDSDRLSGWTLCFQYLSESTPCEFHRAKGWKTCPMFHVFEDGCPMFIETIPTLVHDPLKPEDLVKKNSEDHLADAWRYLCMMAGNFASPVFYDDVVFDEILTPAEQKIMNKIEDAKPIYPAKTAADLFGGFSTGPFGGENS